MDVEHSPPRAASALSDAHSSPGVALAPAPPVSSAYAASANRRKRRLLSALTGAEGEELEAGDATGSSEAGCLGLEAALEQKKRRQWEEEDDEEPPLRCWSAQELPSELTRLSRSASSQTPPSAPRSLGPRQLSAAAIDAAALVHKLVLPTVHSSEHPDLNVISPETVARVLGGEFHDRLASFELIDCRFPFEHVGGSLRGSRSLYDPISVEEAFMVQPRPDSVRVALIFFCEFSANRAPKMARHMRNLDRWIHADRYPELFYPELYLIDGGYKNCFEKLKDEICDPPTYVSMNDEKFSDECRVEFSTWRRKWKAHKLNDCAKQWRHPSSSSVERKRNITSTTTATTKWRKARPSTRPVQSLMDML